jgi:glycosyltransferase involved in cell wall biosynthesis
LRCQNIVDDRGDVDWAEMVGTYILRHCQQTGKLFVTVRASKETFQVAEEHLEGTNREGPWWIERNWLEDATLTNGTVSLSLLRLAKELGIAERCHWHSWVSDAERLDLLNRCQALVIASLWEGFGLPALEAMACGTSVIASRSGALPEVLGNVGQLVNPRSVAEISAAMAAVAGDGAMAAAALREGPARAARFNWADTAREVEQLLAELA